MRDRRRRFNPHPLVYAMALSLGLWAGFISLIYHLLHK